jgi:hypothetical protein
MCPRSKNHPPFDGEYLDVSDANIKELSNPLKLRRIEEEVYLWINCPSNLLSDDPLNEGASARASSKGESSLNIEECYLSRDNRWINIVVCIARLN